MELTISIEPGQVYIYTDETGHATRQVTLRTNEHGIKMTGGLYALPDGRLVEAGGVGYSDGRWWIEREAGTVAANLTYVGQRDEPDTNIKAENAATRINCHLDAPAGYEHTSCLLEDPRTPFRCPFDRDPHYFCDHEDAPCQVARA